MKTFRYILLGLLLTIALFSWLLFICGADSLAENGLLLYALVTVCILTALCWVFISSRDLAKILKISPEEYRNILRQKRIKIIQP